MSVAVAAVTKVVTMTAKTVDNFMANVGNTCSSHCVGPGSNFILIFFLPAGACNSPASPLGLNKATARCKLQDPSAQPSRLSSAKAWQGPTFAYHSRPLRGCPQFCQKWNNERCEYYFCSSILPHVLVSLSGYLEGNAQGCRISSIQFQLFVGRSLIDHCDWLTTGSYGLGEVTFPNPSC